MSKWCHFKDDPETGEKVLIPGCWSVVHSDNIEDCTCRPERSRFKKDIHIEMNESHLKELIDNKVLRFQNVQIHLKK